MSRCKACNSRLDIQEMLTYEDFCKTCISKTREEHSFYPDYEDFLNISDSSMEDEDE